MTTTDNNFRRAVLIGINYEGTRSALRGCINDVNNVKTLLITKYGYTEDNILYLTDSSTIKPTKANILKSFEWLLSSSKSSSFTKGSFKPLTSNSYNFSLHYSGHGTQILDKNFDEVDGLDEAICPLDYEANGMIVDDIIRSKLALKVPDGSRLTAIMDCCNSGSNFDLLWNVIPANNGYNLTKIGRYLGTPGKVIMLSGCRDNQTSADVNFQGLPQGALTNSLINVLKSNNYNIAYDDLLSQVRTYIVTNKLSDQIPCLSFGKNISLDEKFSF